MSAATQHKAEGHKAEGDEEEVQDEDVARLGGMSVGCFLGPCGRTFGYEKQHFCHVEGSNVGEQELELLLEYWELDRPNLILEMLGPVSPHPTKLVTKDMLEHPEMDVHENEVRDMLRVLGNENADDEETIIAALGGKLYEKLIQSTMALLKACEQTNSWIIFREGPQTTMVIVRDALSRCDARPVIFVCEHSTAYPHNDVMDRILESKTSLALAGQSPQPPTTTKIRSGWSQEYSAAEPNINKNPIAKNPCSFATHYIFSKSWSPVTYSKLAPKGIFFISGGGGCGRTMAASVASSQPSIFMLHTGLASDIFGSAIEAILNQNCTTADAVVAKMKEVIPSRDDKGVHYFGLLSATDLYNYVSGLLAAHKANPREFKAANVVLNSWVTTPEEVLNRLSLCFSSASSGGASLEVGASEAKQQSITAAWKIHCKLQHNCGTFKRTSDYMTVIGTLLSLATTVFSVIAIWLEMSGEKVLLSDGWQLSEVLQFLLILLPALGGLVITSLSRFRYLSKWGSMHVAMMETESEIWKFRASHGEYDISGAQEQNEDKKKKKKKGKEGGSEKKKDGNSTRRIFTARISDSFSGLMGGEMQVDSLEEPSESTYLLIGSETANGAHKDGFDDNGSDLSGENYYQYRLIPQLDALKKQAPVLSQRLMRYEILILISTLVTTLLATMQFKVWIPVAVAFSAMFATFMQYEGLQMRLTAVNGAITDLTRFSTDWAAMGVLERRGRLCKALMVQLTEGAILRVATAYSGGAASGKSSGEVKEKAGEDNEKSKKDE